MNQLPNDIIKLIKSFNTFPKFYGKAKNYYNLAYEINADCIGMRFGTKLKSEDCSKLIYEISKFIDPTELIIEIDFYFIKEYGERLFYSENANSIYIEIDILVDFIKDMDVLYDFMASLNCP